jgi:hypothetical protein
MSLRLGFLALLVAVGLAAEWGAAAEPAVDSDRAIAAHVAAGEFAPALRLAEKTDDANLRDRQLALIATAQRRAGATAAAVQTAGRIVAAGLRADAYADAAIVPLDRGTSAGNSIKNDAQNFGGGAEPDFESVMELITSTVAPPTWTDVGGAGSIKGFANGVYIDAEGLLHKLDRAADAKGALDLLRAEANKPRSDLPVGDMRRVSRLRKVSLPRLERAVAERAALGQAPDDAMRQLAGLARIEYIFVYPETGDLVLAGPAGPTRVDNEGRIMNAESGRPVLQLEDLVVVLRHVLGRDDAMFGCSITPTEGGLAATRRFAEEAGRQKLAAGEKARDKWIAGLRSALGKQKIDVFGIDPQTRVAQVLVEADYRMKLVGLGLEEGVLGVPSYLSSVRVGTDGSLPALDVLRWWFTLDYDAIAATEKRDAFAIRGQGVRVMSENQFLAATGKREGTGESSPANGEFAHNFTKHFADLASKYPVYAELQNLCDAALVAAVIKSEKLDDAAGWEMAWFGDDNRFAVAKSSAPRTVDTVATHRMIGGKHIVAAVSGGVRIEPAKFASRERIQTTKSNSLAGELKSSRPAEDAAEQWWWD